MTKEELIKIMSDYIQDHDIPSLIQLVIEAITGQEDKDEREQKPCD